MKESRHHNTFPQLDSCLCCFAEELQPNLFAETQSCPARQDNVIQRLTETCSLSNNEVIIKYRVLEWDRL
jgi:hypothetical protein